MSDQPRVGRWPRLAAGAAVGASAWLSAGTLAVIDAATITRLGALPAPGWLAAAVGVGAGVAWMAPLTRAALTALSPLLLIWLPWLPLRVPSPFLLWEGPIETAVWVAAVGGVLWRVVPRPRSVTPWLAPPRAPVIAGVIAALVFTVAWLVARPRVPAGDEPHYLVITQSLLYDGDVRIENNHQQEQYFAYFDGLLRPDFMQRGVDRQIYSIHAPGLSAVVLPAFALAGYPGAVATVVASLAAGTAAAWLAAWWLTGSTGAAWAAWLGLLASAPLVLHGYTLYPDPVGAAAAMAGVLGLVALETGAASSFGVAAWAAIGAALALLPWLHTRFALLAGVIGVAIVLRLWRRDDARRALAAFAAVPLVAAAGWFLYFWRIYGTPNPAAPYGARPEGGVGFILSGLTGLLSDQQFGLVATAPVLLAAVAGLVPLAGRRPRLTIELAAIVVPYLAAVAAYPMWWGGYSAPGRFSLVVLLTAVLPLAALWTSGPLGRGLVATLTAVSAAITVAFLAPERGAFIYNGRDGHALLLDWLSPTVDLTLGAPSVHRDGAAVAAADALVWVVAIVAVAGVWLWLSRARPRAAITAAVGVLAAPLAATLALPVVWAGQERTAITPPTSQMSFIGRWHPAARPLGVELTPTRGLTLADLTRRLSLDTSLRGRRPSGPAPLLQIPQVPAGEYDVFVDGRSRLEGTVTVRLGRHDLPLAVWPLDGRSSGFTGLVLRLPATAHSIAIDGDDAARAAIRRLSLRPRVLPSSQSGQPQALRAAHIGPVALFALDDNAYLESGALWIRGERTAQVLVQPDEGRAAVVRLQGGPVANTVTLTTPQWRSAIELAANAVREVPLPPEALAPAVLSVTSATGFRPSEQSPGNGDVRWLGVYLTWP